MKTKVAILTVLILASISAYAVATQNNLVIGTEDSYYSEGGPSMICGTGDDTCLVRTGMGYTQKSDDCSKCADTDYWSSFKQFDSNCDPVGFSDPQAICTV